MSGSRHRRTRVERLGKGAAAPTPDEAELTPHERLVRAAENGQFEALVAKAQPAEPVVMVTPEEREAELRAKGQWPADKREPKPAPPPTPEPEPPAELSPQQQYIDEHCHWRARDRSYYGPRHRENQCITEYNVLTGEIEGDGYIHHEDEDEEW